MAAFHLSQLVSSALFYFSSFGCSRSVSSFVLMAIRIDSGCSDDEVGENRVFAKPLLQCLTSGLPYKIWVRMLQPSTCLCGLTWMILLKVSWLLPNLEVYGERVTLVDLASLSIVSLRVFIEMATISKVVFLVHLWGANYQPFDNCVMMALLFLAPVYAEYVMWIWSATMHSLYVFLYSFNLIPENFSYL